jgi:hypothetical protein
MKRYTPSIHHTRLRIQFIYHLEYIYQNHLKNNLKALTMSTNNASVEDNEEGSNVLLLGLSYVDFNGCEELWNNLYNIDNVKPLVDAIVTSISDQVRSGNMTEIDGRYYIRFIFIPMCILTIQWMVAM